MKPVLAALIACVFAAPAFAQEDADGWDLGIDASGELIVASVAYEGGVGIAIQCHERSLDVALTGVPAATDGEIDQYRRRTLNAGVDPDLRQDSWRSGPDGRTVTSFLPQRTARSLKVGGVFVVETRPTDPGVRGGRIEIPLPSDSSAIDRVLQACGYRTVDPRDALELVDLSVEGWSRSRQFQMPSPTRAMRRDGPPYQVDVSCIIAEQGRVRDCQVERETHEGLGAAMLQDARNVRFDIGDAPEAVGQIVFLTVTGSTVIRR